MNKTSRIARPTPSTNGKISAYSMVLALVQSGVALDRIALVAQLTDAERTQIMEQVA